MYEHATQLTNPGSAGGAASTVAAVLLPGSVSNGTARRKIVGTGADGLPVTLDIRGDILPPAGVRRYSVARITLTINEVVSNDTQFGPAPVTATTVTLNIPFGVVGTASISWADVTEVVRRHICWQLQYLRGAEFTTTASSGDAALFSSIVTAAGLSAALAQIADGIR